MDEWVRAIWNVAGAILLSLGGGAGIVVVLSSWLGKVWANRILEQDRARYSEALEGLKNKYELATVRFQADLDHLNLVNRVQFETEFNALVEIWGRLVAAAATFEVLRPPTGRRSKEVLKPRIEEHGEAVGAFSKALHQRSPFYPREIFDGLMEFQRLATLEAIEVGANCEDDGVSNADWYTQGHKRREEMVALTERISDLIRSRVASLTVVQEGRRKER